MGEVQFRDSIHRCTWAVLATCIFDLGSKVYRDFRLRRIGSSAKPIPFMAPLGLDVGIYSLYRFFTNTYFDLVSAWLDASPGRTVEMRMFSQGLILTDEPANIKAIMSTEWSSFGKGEVTRRIWVNMIGQRQIFASKRAQNRSSINQKGTKRSGGSIGILKRVLVDGEHWQKAKALLRPHVSAKEILPSVQSF